MIRTISKYYHTLKHLKPIQFRYRFFYFLRRKIRKWSGFQYKDREHKKGVLITPEAFVCLPKTYLGDGVFTFLNIEHRFGNKIDWNYEAYGKLWTYNLNYFEYLGQKNIEVKEGLDLIVEYIRRQSELKDGLEPFPISLRIMNWIKFILKNHIQDDLIDQSLYKQLYILQDNLEYHLLGNHLLENGFSLLMGGIYFEEETFIDSARQILIPQLEEQILEDGGHFELSPMYHQHMLTRVLDCVNLLEKKKAIAKDILSLLRGKAALMLGWLEQISFEKGEIPLLNDSANKIAPTSIQLFDYAARLGLEKRKIALSTSGYRKIKKKKYEAIIDIGNIGPDYIPGHAHSDTLNIVLYINDKPVLVDTGTSEYNIGGRRELERSTKSHNTVEIDGMEQSECWAGFRVARRAYAEIIEEEPDKIIATHSGYNRINAKHTRCFEFSNNSLLIKDSLKKDKKKSGAAHFHFHPDALFDVEKESLSFNNQNVSITFEGANKIELGEFKYAPEFNLLKTSKKIIVYFEGVLITKISIL